MDYTSNSAYNTCNVSKAPHAPKVCPIIGLIVDAKIFLPNTFLTPKFH
jgi:hypothetical protein